MFYSWGLPSVRGELRGGTVALRGPWCVCSWGPAPARELHKGICSARPGATTEEWGPATTGPVGWTAGSSGGAEPRAARLPVMQGLRWARQGLPAAEAHGAVASLLEWWWPGFCLPTAQSVIRSAQLLRRSEHSDGWHSSPLYQTLTLVWKVCLPHGPRLG